MSAQRREAEQFTMPLPVMLAKSTLGQLRAERDALIERLLVLAGHRNQVVSIPRERLEQIACVAVCGTTWSEEVQMDWFMPNSTVAKWARSLPSRRWRERLHSLRALGERIVIAEMQAAPNAKRLSVLPPPPNPPATQQAALFSELTTNPRTQRHG